MYGVIKENEFLAVHEELDVIESYLYERKDKDECQIIKIKKHKRKELELNGIFSDIYLVRFKDKYLPYQYYESMKDIDSEIDYDLRYCRDILNRILEDGQISIKESKILIQAIKIVSDQLANIELPDEQILKELNEYRTMWNRDIE